MQKWKEDNATLQGNKKETEQAASFSMKEAN